MIAINLAEQRHMRERGRDGFMFMCARVYTAALCGNTVRIVAPWSLTGWPPLPYYIEV